MFLLKMRLSAQKTKRKVVNMLARGIAGEKTLKKAEGRRTREGASKKIA